MTRADALRAARALLDGMAGTTEGEWWADGHAVWRDTDPAECSNVCLVESTPDAAHIARSCPARLGPVLRALMEREE